MAEERSVRTRIDTEPDFIALKRFDYSLAKALDRYPDGLPSPLIAQALDITEAQVEEHYQNVVKKLRETLDVI